MSFKTIAELALDDIRERSQKRIYQRDFAAWKADVLGLHTYDKMNQIMHEALFGEKNRTVIKSSNGTSKSFESAAAITWAASVFPTGESTSIASAPSSRQVSEVIFAYLKTMYNMAYNRGHLPPGWITEQQQWKAKNSIGNNITLVEGIAPNPSDAVSKFQGLRNQYGRTFVFFDEAGGMPVEMWTALQAVITGAEARFIGIGNPDHTGTEFQRIFNTPEHLSLYNTFTISSFDLPTLTGERVYPRTPDGDVMEERMLKSLTQKKWVEDMKQLWGESDARYQAKVLGEFPDGGSNTFFKQTTINKAYNSEIEPLEEDHVQLGVDVSRYGDDVTVVYKNHGGVVRLLDSWSETDTYSSARRIHDLAVESGAKAVVIDAVGVGAGTVDALERSPEFANGGYKILGLEASAKSPDPRKHVDLKTFVYDRARELMDEGLVSLDPSDLLLKGDLEAITYEINTRDRIRITPKDKIRRILKRSPDNLDAVVYALTPVEEVFGDPLSEFDAGDTFVVDIFEMYEIDRLNMAGRPL